MAHVRILRFPPVVEALIDFQYVVENVASVEALEVLASGLKSSGDTVTRRERSVAEVRVQHEGEMIFDNPVKKFEAFIIKNVDESRVIQLRQTGVTVSQVKTYQGWDSLESLALSVNDAFIEHMRPVRISRAATRYINQLQLPAGSIDLDDFFTCGPKIPERGPQLVVDFDHRTVVVDQESQLGASFALTTMKREPGTRRPFILDIDVFTLELDCANSHSLRPVLGRIREAKNNIFFGSITEKVLEDLA